MFKIQKIVKFFIFFFCFNIFSSISQSNEDVPLNNIAINETPIPIPSLIFEDFSGKKIDLKDYEGKLLIINFWATWCAPCKKEMPSLDNLYQNESFKNLEIFAVNMEQPNKIKTQSFFKDLNIYSLGTLLVPYIFFLFRLCIWRGKPEYQIVIGFVIQYRSYKNA